MLSGLRLDLLAFLRWLPAVLTVPGTKAGRWTVARACPVAGIALGVLVLAACRGGASPDEFSKEVYPSPVPTREGTNISSLSAGCPNPSDIDVTASLDFNTALRVLTTLRTGDFSAKRHVADQAYWPLITPESRGSPLPRDWLEVSTATASPYGDLLANACGDATAEASYWVEACPEKCADAELESPSLLGHYYLINRHGTWLVWAAR